MFRNKMQNTLVIGGAGSMKTYGYVIPRLMESDCSCVIHDPFGEILENTGDLLKEKGYDVRVLDFRFFDTGTERLGYYNPFAYVESEEEIHQIADTIIGETGDPERKSFGEPDFFEIVEKHLLSAMMLYLLAEYRPEDRTFANLMKFYVGGKEDPVANVDELFSGLEAKEPENSAVKQYIKFKEYAANEKILRATLISCAVRLSIFRVKNVQTLTNADDIDLRSIRSRKTAFFVITNPNDNSFAPLVTLLYEQVMKYASMLSSDRNSGEFPVHFILDEFQGLRGFAKGVRGCPGVLRFLSQSKTCCFSFVVQSLYQLKNMYPEDWEQFMENCDEIHYYGGNDRMTYDNICWLAKGKVNEMELRCMDRDKVLVLRKCIFEKGYSAEYILKKRWEKK